MQENKKHNFAFSLAGGPLNKIKPTIKMYSFLLWTERIFGILYLIPFKRHSQEVFKTPLTWIKVTFLALLVAVQSLVIFKTVTFTLFIFSSSFDALNIGKPSNQGCKNHGPVAPVGLMKVSYLYEDLYICTIICAISYIIAVQSSAEAMQTL